MTSSITAIQSDTLPTSDFGAITMWDCSSTALDPLEAAWADAKLTGVTGRALPRPLAPNPALALAEACRHVADLSRYVVRRHPHGGQLLIAEELTTTGQPDQPAPDPTYTAELRVTLDKGDVLVFSQPSHPLVRRIRDRYHELRGTLTPKAAGSWLAQVVRDLDGIALRRAGGMYYLPASSQPTWDAAISLLGQVCPQAVTVYRIPAYESAGDTMPAVLAAAQDELASRISSLARELEGKDLGERARKTKQDEIAALLDQVGRYERICNASLADLRAAGERVQLSLATSQLEVMGGLMEGL